MHDRKRKRSVMAATFDRQSDCVVVCVRPRRRAAGSLNEKDGVLQTDEHMSEYKYTTSSRISIVQPVLGLKLTDMAGIR